MNRRVQLADPMGCGESRDSAADYGDMVFVMVWFAHALILSVRRPLRQTAGYSSE